MRMLLVSLVSLFSSIHYDASPGAHYDGAGPDSAEAAPVDPLLPTSITINSVEVDAIAVYQASEATTGDWIARAGPDLTAGGSGHSVGDDSFFAQTAPAADGVGTGYWKTTDTSADLGSGDIVLEFIVKTPSSGNNLMAGTNAGIFNAGIHLYRRGTNDMVVFIRNTGGSAKYMGISGSTTDGAWTHIILVIDRSLGARYYVDGVANHTAVTITGSLASGAGISILSNTNALAISEGKVAWFAMWESTGWLDTYDQDTWATARHGLLL